VFVWMCGGGVLTGHLGPQRQLARPPRPRLPPGRAVHQGSAEGEDNGRAEGPGGAPGHPRGYQGRAYRQPVKVEPDEVVKQYCIVLSYSKPDESGSAVGVPQRGAVHRIHRMYQERGREWSTGV